LRGVVERGLEGRRGEEKKGGKRREEEREGKERGKGKSEFLSVYVLSWGVVAFFLTIEGKNVVLLSEEDRIWVWM
jgi:hypothetical protein